MLQPLRKTDQRDVGSYRLVARLPAGGMADVYLGREPRGQVFVVKVAKADPAGVLADQFPQEMSAARRVHGRYLAELVGMDPYASPPWLATQYVPGPSLLDVVRLHGPLPVASARALAGGLADALACIHRSNVMHGDLTPGNVLLLADGPRVIDFGISSLLEATTTLALDAPRFGTPGYLAPERLGPTAVRPTTASDVYALGALLHFALTGQPPHGRPDGTPQVDRLPESLRPLVASCLAPSPDERPDTAHLLSQVLPAGATVGSLYAADWLPPAVYAQISGHRAELDRLLAELDAAPAAPPPPAPGPARVVPPGPPPGPQPGPQPISPHSPQPISPHSPQPAPPHSPQPSPQPAWRPAPPPVHPPVPARRSRRGALLAGAGIAVAVAAAATMLATWPKPAGSQAAPPAGSQAAPPDQHASQGLAVIATGSPSPGRTGIDEQPCRFETRQPPLDRLPYRCPIVWDLSGATLTRVPVFATYDQPNLDASGKIDELVKGPKPQYFKCHIQGAVYHFPAQAGLPEANHDWWAYTQGDHDHWGYVPEVYLLGGDDYLPDSGLERLCTADDTKNAGRT
jgi:eukaryotic-like serine/threonine-protein kinase